MCSCADVPGGSPAPVPAGLPSTDNLRFHQNFVLSFDSAKRNAKWVLEHITKDSSSGQGSRADAKFFEDAGLEPRFRSRLEDYRNSGYDRGHLVSPACATPPTACDVHATPCTCLYAYDHTERMSQQTQVNSLQTCELRVLYEDLCEDRGDDTTCACHDRHQLSITRGIRGPCPRPSP